MKIKKLIALLLITIFIIIFTNYTSVNAASVTLDVPTNITVGETINAKINGKAEQWDLTLKANGANIASSNNLTNEGAEISITASGTYIAKEAGNVTFTLTGDYSYTENGAVKTQEVNITKTVIVNEKKEEEPKQETPSQPTTPTETKKEIDFTVASGTIYTTVDSLNFRSISDGSVIGSITTKGTALERTGIASGKVRVKYNGKEGYVSADYVTTTKPEVKKEEEKKEEEEKQEEKSSNANLKSLSIEGQKLTPDFSKDVTSYTLNVDKDIEKLEINAEAEDTKASVQIAGNESLKQGENIVTVSVSAEDGTVKIYEIKVEKGKENKTLGLSTLKIENTNIEQNFKTDLYNYEIDIKEDISKLEIEAIANDENATVEILGNEGLQEGENIITIIVSSKDGLEKVTYQIKVNKIIAPIQTVTAYNFDKNIVIYGIIAAIVLVALFIVVWYVIKHRKQENDEFEDYYDDEDFENNEEIDEEMKIDNNTIEETPRIDYMYEDEKPKRKKGKHF